MGGHGRVVADLVRALGHQVVAYADAAITAPKGGGGPAPVELPEAVLLDRAGRVGRLPEGVDAVALGVGANGARLQGARCIADAELPVLMHPSAVVSGSCTLGPGAVVLPLAVINAGARIGLAVIVNSGAIVEHDCVLADGAHVSPGAVLAGGVEVGERAWIGAGATVLPGIQIKADAIVGAGAVVTRNVGRGVTVVGVPAAALAGK